jgi:hypothetical protein
MTANEREPAVVLGLIAGQLGYAMTRRNANRVVLAQGSGVLFRPPATSGEGQDPSRLSKKSSSAASQRYQSSAGSIIDLLGLGSWIGTAKTLLPWCDDPSFDLVGMSMSKQH